MDRQVQEAARDPSRRVLVTGAARGIGRATAEAFGRAGWRVVAGVRTPDALEPYESEAIDVVPLDVTDHAMVEAGVAEAERLLGGPIGCVVNNAGWALFGAVEDLDLDAARREFETNVFGAVAVLQAALPGMRAGGGGVIVNVSTLAGRLPLPLFGMYSATKLSLGALSEALALEVAPAGVRVVLLELGVVDTDFAASTVVSGSAGEPDSAHARTRDRVLGLLRAIRSDSPLEAAQVAGLIVAAAEDPSSPSRLVVPDEGLRPLLERVERAPEQEVHDLIREAFELDRPPAPEDE